MKEWIQVARRGQRNTTPRFGRALLLHPDPVYAQIEAAFLVAQNKAARIEVYTSGAAAQTYMQEALSGRRVLPGLIVIYKEQNSTANAARIWDFLQRLTPDCVWEIRSLDGV